uniref:Uncharacterized protein n=1 Tax=Setaria italica TaxID=4555 RepID=K3XP48_SETIT
MLWQQKGKLESDEVKDVWLRTHPSRICDAPVTAFCTCFLTVLTMQRQKQHSFRALSCKGF